MPLMLLTTKVIRGLVRNDAYLIQRFVTITRSWAKLSKAHSTHFLLS